MNSALPSLLVAALLLAGAPAHAASPSPPLASRSLAPSPPPPPPTAETLARAGALLADVPILRTFRVDASDAAWSAVKRLSSPASQLRAVGARKLRHTVCSDLVDLRALVHATGAPFSFRDDHRGRSWARASLALVLFEALDRFARERPGQRVSLGDISQPGCGQLDHGTLVRDLQGEAALALLDRARVSLSAPTVVDELRARAFPGEADRFETGDERIRVERVVVARGQRVDADLRLRVAERRHMALSPPTADDVATLEADTRRIATRRNVVAQTRTWSDDRGERLARWRTHWVDRRARRQLVAITADKPTRRFTADDALELRWSAWRPKQPGSFPGEVRWLRAPADAPAPWERWRLVYEAGHISHHSGLDADLSYVTADNERHFAVDLEAMDVAGTWRWFELLVEAGEALGHPVELILIDAKVKRHLAKNLPAKARRSPLFTRILRISGGHDGHHHLRLAASTRSGERRAAAALVARIARAERRVHP